MRGKRTLMVAAAVIAPTVAAAQTRQGIAVVPMAGYSIPGTLAEGTDVSDPTVNYSFKPKGAPAVGLQLELGLSKNVSFGVGGNLTFGQTLDVDYADPSFSGTVGEADIRATQVFGAVSFRPGGRRPNGAVTPLAIEGGGGFSMWSFDKFLVDTDGDGIQEAIPADDWNGSEAFAFAGVAYNVPIGPRASLQLFGRGVVRFGYTSDGLDDFNAASPPSNVEGKTVIGALIGGGLRVGR